MKLLTPAVAVASCILASQASVVAQEYVGKSSDYDLVKFPGFDGAPGETLKVKCGADQFATEYESPQLSPLGWTVALIHSYCNNKGYIYPYKP